MMKHRRTAWMRTSFLSCSVTVASASLPSGSCLSSVCSTCFTCSILFSSRLACGFSPPVSNLTSSCCLCGGGVPSWLLASCLLRRSGATMSLVLLMSCSALRDISASRIGGVSSGRRNCCTRLLFSLLGCGEDKMQLCSALLLLIDKRRGRATAHRFLRFGLRFFLFGLLL